MIFPRDWSGRPDWVVVGVPFPDGRVGVIASQDLKKAEMEMERARPDEVLLEVMAGPLRDLPMRTNLHLVIGEWHLVIGETYAEAFTTLFNNWNPPERAAPPQIPGQRQKEIER